MHLHIRKPHILALAVLALMALVILGTRPMRESGRSSFTLRNEYLTVTTRSLVTENAVGRYSLNVAYPQLSGLSSRPIEAKINGDMERTISTEVGEFMKAATTEVKSPFGVATSTLDITYSVEYSGPRIVSFRIEHSPYTAGSAHPNGFVSGLTYDLETGDRVKLKTLFSQVDYLAVLSGYALREVAKQLEPFSDKNKELEDWIKEGTAPKEENYAEFFLRRDALVIIMNPYQVAPYVFGEREVVLPLTDLQSLMAPEWQQLLAK